MNTIAEIVGYAFIFTCVGFALAYAWEKLARALFNRMMDTEDFFKVVVLYARTRRRKRKADRVGPADE